MYIERTTNLDMKEADLEPLVLYLLSEEAIYRQVMSAPTAPNKSTCKFCIDKYKKTKHTPSNSALLKSQLTPHIHVMSSVSSSILTLWTLLNGQGQ